MPVLEMQIVDFWLVGRVSTLLADVHLVEKE